MDPSLAKCSRTLESVLRAYQMFAEKGDSSSCIYGKAHLTGSLLCNCISYGSARRQGKKVLETLDVASTNSNCQREERARGTFPSFVDLVVFKISGSALQSAFQMIDFTGRCD